MDFGLMFFSCSPPGTQTDPYRLLKDVASFADSHGYRALWTPERHFHSFGGAFPSPAVVSAALAMITQRIQIRAGSVVSPLHHAIRVAEEWSIVDNLSGGRVAISFGSGWNIDDFVFFPERYGNRQQIMYEQIDEIKKLWKGEPVIRTNSAGREIPISILPRPMQSTLPIWVTSSGSANTFKRAGEIGANILTHLIGQDIGSLREKIMLYRAARSNHGHEPASGIVSLMLHTFVGTDLVELETLVRPPLREYLRSALSIERSSVFGGGVISGGHALEMDAFGAEDTEDLLDLAVERYINSSALIGTPESCLKLVRTLEESGVDEIACLIDFGLPNREVMTSLEVLNELRRLCAAEFVGAESMVADFSS